MSPTRPDADCELARQARSLTASRQIPVARAESATAPAPDVQSGSGWRHRGSDRDTHRAVSQENVEIVRRYYEAELATTLDQWAAFVERFWERDGDYYPIRSFS